MEGPKLYVRGMCRPALIIHRSVSSLHSDSSQSGRQEAPERWPVWNDALHCQANEGEFVDPLLTGC